MPFLIDGNNLIYALDFHGCNVGRQGLTELAGELAASGERLALIFDGAPSEGTPVRYSPVAGLVVRYAEHMSADVILLERIASDSAPRRLIVVSSDREIRQAARRRHCQDVPSEVFAPAMLRRIERIRQPGKDVLPPEKYFGLSSLAERNAWLDTFGMGDLAQRPDDPTEMM